MYKLFLCLRYLRSRVLAYFAVLAVALCVAMMLIVVSVMNGFLRKIELAAKGLFGDIVIESAGEHGLAYYDEFIREIEHEVPQVESASPFILSYGVLRLPGYPTYRQPIHVAGVRLPNQARVTDFELGLFAQAGAENPTFDPPAQLLAERVAEDREEILQILVKEQQVLRAMKEDKDSEGAVDKTITQENLIWRLRGAIYEHERIERRLLNAGKHQDEMRKIEVELEEAQRSGASDERLETLEARMEELVELSGIQRPADRVILGLGISGLSFRTDKGRTIRTLILPGSQVVLYVFPTGRHLDMAGMSPTPKRLTVVDDCKSGVWSIDSKIVYLPFRSLQLLNNMAEEYDPDDPKKIVAPARCSQIHVKVREEFSHEPSAWAVLSHKLGCTWAWITGKESQPIKPPLETARDAVRARWLDFQKRYPEASATGVSIDTWRQRQADVVGPIEAQRTLSVIMIGVISFVAILLILVIFYIIVMQKTRDIGVMKSLGASSGGVAGIFLAYSAAVGLVGAVLGAVIGYVFVWNINSIHDWLGRAFAFQVWSRKTFMFDEIPNDVATTDALWVVLVTICASVIGALIPAIRAGRMQPVEALRYE